MLLKKPAVNTILKLMILMGGSGIGGAKLLIRMRNLCYLAQVSMVMAR